MRSALLTVSRNLRQISAITDSIARVSQVSFASQQLFSLVEVIWAERMEREDAISGAKFVSKYKYRHEVYALDADQNPELADKPYVITETNQQVYWSKTVPGGRMRENGALFDESKVSLNRH